RAEDADRRDVASADDIFVLFSEVFVRRNRWLAVDLRLPQDRSGLRIDRKHLVAHCRDENHVMDLVWAESQIRDVERLRIDRALAKRYCIEPSKGIDVDVLRVEVRLGRIDAGSPKIISLHQDIHDDSLSIGHDHYSALGALDPICNSPMPSGAGSWGISGWKPGGTATAG